MTWSYTWVSCPHCGELVEVAVQPTPGPGMGNAYEYEIQGREGCTCVHTDADEELIADRAADALQRGDR